MPHVGWDHPRMRGEHATDKWDAVVAWGSSPHARGTLVRSGLDPSRARIIPACAGNTDGLDNRFKRDGDHPRMRGEHRT